MLPACALVGCNQLIVSIVVNREAQAGSMRYVRRSPTVIPDPKIKTRRIAVLTTSRADYGHLYWPLIELKKREDIDLRLLVTGAHLSPEFGMTIREIEADGFKIEEIIESLLSSDTDVGMAKTIGLATLSLADTLGRIRPDILLLIADRYEMLAPASVALALRIPIAHIEGGEVSEGAIDDAVRNALTKLSHIHFVPTTSARRRVIAMGEEPWRVHQTGAPSLDHIRRGNLPSRRELESVVDLDLSKPTLLVTHHAVTLQDNTTADVPELIAALDELGLPTIFSFPNADAGGRAIMNAAREYSDEHDNSRLVINLGHRNHLGLLFHVAAMIGNSSSGIMEAPAAQLPVVNIGIRQRGRERAANIVDVDPVRAEIAAGINKALSEQFRASLDGMINPYGDGHAAEKIADVLSSIELGERLLVKRALPLADDGYRFDV
jgi:UDP-N-acetylglucosamine 2-epimerase (non-hydrolysing)/GDP/UDP-N,N'-diacetylbacillosamine 2-epimerase (hydrolysing)